MVSAQGVAHVLEQFRPGGPVPVSHNDIGPGGPGKPRQGCRAGINPFVVALASESGQRLLKEKRIILIVIDVKDAAVLEVGKRRTHAKADLA